MGKYVGDVEILDESGALLDKAEAHIETRAVGNGWGGFLESQPGEIKRWKAGPVKLRLKSGEEIDAEIQDPEVTLAAGFEMQSARVVSRGDAPTPF